MTDNEIIKALECCTTKGASCKDCPAFMKVDRSNCKKFFKGALDLINRQKDKIEFLEEKLDNLEYEFDLMREEKEAIESRAVKEFAERLKLKVDIDLCEAIECSDYLYNLPKLIDNLVKEMVGEE